MTACAVVLVASGCASTVPLAQPAAKKVRLIGFPRPSDVGVPAHWRPKETRRHDMVITREGTVVQDVRFVDADLFVNAPHVTVRRVEMQGGRIINVNGNTCENGLRVEDSTFAPLPGRRFTTDSEGATGVGGYTALRVKIWRREEGFRDGGRSSGCGPVRIIDSFAKISIPRGCPGDPHSDGLQGFDGPPLTVRNVTIDFREADCGTAPVFVPESQGNTSMSVDRLLVMGGGATFRLGVHGSVRGLKVVDRSWTYFPVDVNCALVSRWDADVVRIAPDYKVRKTVRRLACT